MAPILITGPTTSGKTAIVAALAKRMRCAVFNSDKFHLFQEYKIGIGRGAESSLAEEHLYQVLDPTSEVLPINDYRARLTRALAAETTAQRIIEGASFSYNEMIATELPLARAYCLVPRDDHALRKNIVERVESIFAMGVVNETEALMKRGYATSYVMRKGIIYRSVVALLSGAMSVQTTKEKIVRDAYHAAIEQRRRYLRLKDVVFIDSHVPCSDVVSQIAADARGPRRRGR